MFVGRTAELALLGAELRAACAGRARTVVVDGPEGIGKTALVRRLVDGEAAERGCRVLAVAGEAGERGLRLGLLRELAAEAGRLPVPVRWPPCGLPGRERVTAAGQAVCDALAGAPAGGPIVLVVDDAQWADTASLHALAYVLRRLRGVPVLTIVACRDLGGPWLPDGLRRLLTADDAVHVPLGGLTATDLADLSAATPRPPDRPQGTLGAEAAGRLHDHTLGNPLHARALLDAVPLPVLEDPAVRLPAPATYARPFARRLGSCAPAARRLVTACAVLGDGCPLHVAAAVAGRLGDPLKALEEARVLLDLGRLLRRTGRRRAAAGRLAAARAVFVRLGAPSPAERCLQELEACGLETSATARLGLTPQELSTATLVAHGLTNRQIAAELFISVKTVEYHIGKIYTKLGIGSRVALAAKVTAGGA
ncbi:Putative HTH-type transcriptional regulator [Nonomuraea coxensis DSM 45129]|uniref:HTH-type transcriptional regulator n=1 Tax=Nonomuraea coxensis DSM 45129 TaxID=1122611 RepID=A0ABX8U2Q1_9ACTN|nr:LuxR family transcriptional regulator [Nonomuraea coxensis]QYC41409.1 Putative HTH-type transcriptional regulator [Nonomuraea coxensis DSM 45129]